MSEEIKDTETVEEEPQEVQEQQPQPEPTPQPTVGDLDLVIEKLDKILAQLTQCEPETTGEPIQEETPEEQVTEEEEQAEVPEQDVDEIAKFLD